MSYFTKPQNHNLADGDFTSEAIQLDKNHCMVSAVFSGLAANDVTVQLEQSIDTENWAETPESKVTMIAGETSHMWVLKDNVACSFVRIKVESGSAVSGVFEKIKVLTS